MFSFHVRNHLTLRLETSKQLLPMAHLPYSEYAWVDFMVAVCAIISLLLTFKYIFEVGSLYNALRI